MKLCAVSPFQKASKSEILAFLATATADLVVLPGHSSNTPVPDEVQSVIQGNVSVFVEGKGGTPCLVKKGELIPMPRQIFSHHPSARELDRLSEMLPKRTFSFGSRTVTFLICGEIIAFNPDGNVKHGRQLPYDILANPAHSLMGHWNHLGTKLTNLSLGSAVLYAANNERNHGTITTDVRIYQNGLLLQGRQSMEMLSWCECEI